MYGCLEWGSSCLVLREHLRTQGRSLKTEQRKITERSITQVVEDNTEKQLKQFSVRENLEETHENH